MRFENWGRCASAEPVAIVEPATEAEVVAAVREAGARGRRVKVVGGGHSWSDIACTDGVMLRLDKLCRVLHVDRQQGRVTVEAGIRLRALNDALAAEGLALSIVGSIDRQALAGVIATGTHGSSLTHGNLSSFVVGLRVVLASGEVVDVAEDDPRLPGFRVALGALGVVVQVTLRVEPAFRLVEIAEPMPWDEALVALPSLARGEEYVKLWWLPHTDTVHVARYRRCDEPTTFRPWARWLDEHVINRFVFAALLAFGAAAPSFIPAINRLVAAVYFRRRRVCGRSDHVLTLAMPPVHRETELAIPLEHTVDALRRLRRLVERRRHRVDFIFEVRFVKGDDAWMSPAYGGDVAQIGAYAAGTPDRAAFFDTFAEVMSPYGGRPHWGKELWVHASDVTRLFPMAERFRALRDTLDPERRFGNAFLERVLGP